MSNKFNGLREFGKFRLDSEKHILWCENKPVNLPLKEIELLCVLTENGGEVITKNELLDRVWTDSFVEESNLSRHIYLLRKTFKDLGESGELIQTVPRRGYRFTGEVRKPSADESALVIEKRTERQTLIEIEETTEENFIPQKFIKPLLKTGAVIVTLSVILVAGLAFLGFRSSSAKSALPIKSIAVLPFKTINAAKENEHLGLGLADILITRLSNLKGLTVRPTSAVSAFENQDIDSAQVAKNLNVEGILEGTIYRSENNLRVTLRLLKVNSNQIIWSGQFEKTSADELKIQNEIALQVVNVLALNLSAGEQKALTKSYTENKEAFELYQKGRFEWNKRTWQGSIDAERFFRNAIEKDKDFALAYSGLADTLATGNSADEAFLAAEKSLEIDPDLAEAHASLGFIKMFHSWNWKEAEQELKKSIELNPNYATAHHWYATLLEIEGRNAEAKAEFERALEINPVSYNFLADLGQAYYFNREYEKAEEYCKKSLEIYPEFNFAFGYLYDIYLQKGEYDLAVEKQLESRKIGGSLANTTAAQKERFENEQNKIREIYRKGGIKAYYYNFLATRSFSNPVEFYGAAKIYAFLGENEKALDFLEKAFENKATFAMPFVKAEPSFDNLRSEPRYREILRKMNLF